jgi:hypothetical protein
MIKKIAIFTITLLFLVSTTGMPLVIHYCKIMETASMQACEMHTKEITESSCCQEDDLKETDDCCQDFLVDHSVKEIYILSKTETAVPLQILTFIPADVIINSEYIATEDIHSSTLLIPGNKIYLINSILII